MTLTASCAKFPSPETRRTIRGERPGIPFNAPSKVSQCRARLSQILDLIFEDDRLNVYAGELEVRPPRAPTTEPHQEALDRP